MTANAERDERQAVGILRGERSTPREMLVLAKRLHAQRRTGIARRLLMVARRGLRRDEYRDVYLEIFQKSALYTYKDPHLPLQWRLERALQILREVEDLSRTTNQETLGITGAIHKRMWEVHGRRHHLERALFYYLKSYAVPPSAWHPRRRVPVVSQALNQYRRLTSAAGGAIVARGGAGGPGWRPQKAFEVPSLRMTHNS